MKQYRSMATSTLPAALKIDDGAGQLWLFDTVPFIQLRAVKGPTRAQRTRRPYCIQKESATGERYSDCGVCVADGQEGAKHQTALCEKTKLLQTNRSNETAIVMH